MMDLTYLTKDTGKKKRKKVQFGKEKDTRRIVRSEEPRIVFGKDDHPLDYMPSKIVQELEKCFGVIAEDYYGKDTSIAMRRIRDLVNSQSRELSLFTCKNLYELFTDIENSELADITLAAFTSWPKPSRFPLNEIHLIYKMFAHHFAGKTRNAIPSLSSILENYKFGPFFMLNVWVDGGFLSRELESELLKKCLSVCNGKAVHAYDLPLVKYLVWCERLNDVDRNVLLLSVTRHLYPNDLLTSPWGLYCRSCDDQERLSLAITILLCGGFKNLPPAIMDHLNRLFDCNVEVSSVCILALLICIQLDDIPLQPYVSIFTRVLRERRICREVAGLMYFILLTLECEKHVPLDELMSLIETEAPALLSTEGFTAPDDVFLQFLCSTFPRLARAGELLQLLSGLNEDPNNLITWLSKTSRHTRVSAGKRRRLWIAPLVSYYLICARDLSVREKCWTILENLYVPSCHEYYIELTRRVDCVHMRCRMVLFLYRRYAELIRDAMDLKFEVHKNLKTLKTLTTVIDDSDVLDLFSAFEVEQYQDCSSLFLCLIQLKCSIKRSNYTMPVQLIDQLEHLIVQYNHDQSLLPPCLLAIELMIDLCEIDTSIFERIWRFMLDAFGNTDDPLVRVWTCKFFGKVPTTMKMHRSYAGYCSARILWFTAVASQDSLLTDTALRGLRSFNLHYFDSTFLACAPENEKNVLYNCKELSNGDAFSNFKKTRRTSLTDLEWLELLSLKPTEGVFELFADLCAESRYCEEFDSFERGLQLILNHDIHSRPLVDFASEHNLPPNIDYEFYVNCFRLYQNIIVISSSLLKRENCLIGVLERSSGELKKAVEKVVLPFYTLKVDVLDSGYRKLKRDTSALINRGFEMDYCVFLEELRFLVNPKLSRPEGIGLLIKLLRIAVIDTFYGGKGDPRKCIRSLMDVLNDVSISMFFRRAIFHTLILVWLEEPFCEGSILLCKLLSTLNPCLLLEGFILPNTATMVSTLKYMKLVEYAAIRWQSLKMIMLCLELAKNNPRYQDAALLSLFRFYQSLSSVVKNQRDFGDIYSLMMSCPNNFTFNVFILSSYKFSGLWDVSANQTLLHGIRCFPIALPIIVFRVWQYIAHAVRRDIIGFARDDQTDPVIKHTFYAGARALESAIMIEKNCTTKTVCF